MSHAIFYGLSALWGAVSAIGSFCFASQYVSSCVESIPPDAIGHPSPFLFIVPFLAILALSTLLFLIFDALCAKFWLRSGGIRHFFLALLLYILGLFGAWLLAYAAATVLG